MTAESAKKRAFEYQLHVLTLEINYIENAISRLDTVRQTTKQWAILVWTGSISILIGQKMLARFVLFTALIPILFWIVEARWKYWMGHFSYRQKKISEFLNSPYFQESCEHQELSGFSVLDPLGKSYRDTPEFRKKITFWRAFISAEVSLLYFGMIIISVISGIFLLVFPGT